MVLVPVEYRTVNLPSLSNKPFNMWDIGWGLSVNPYFKQSIIQWSYLDHTALAYSIAMNNGANDNTLLAIMLTFSKLAYDTEQHMNSIEDFIGLTDYDKELIVKSLKQADYYLITRLFPKVIIEPVFPVVNLSKFIKVKVEDYVTTCRELMIKVSIDSRFFDMLFYVPDDIQDTLLNETTSALPEEVQSI